MKTTFIAILTTLTLNSSNAQEMNKKEIDGILTKQVEDNKTPSAQYAIFNADTIIHQFRLGYADIKNNRKSKGSL
ncbi:MAG: hypothetical protein LC117_09665 [Bacteroidia bacterium]|nr:hypothetical protein [Bacteroidia bacterium]MCZ2278181.1 hypothetical protein [Bacteroidia bacterium]